MTDAPVKGATFDDGWTNRTQVKECEMFFKSVSSLKYLHKAKVKLSLEAAMKAQRGSRGMYLLFL
jgi:hypothetical protein